MALYALTPILRKWLSACEKKDVEYFLGLFVLFQIVRTTLAAFLRTTEVLTRLDDLNYLNIVCTFAGYFIRGHYLQTYGLAAKWNKVLILSLPLVCILNVVGSVFANWQKATRADDFANTFGLFTFLTSVALFQLFSSLFKEKSSRPKSIIREISADTLGIYMIHLIIINLPFMQVVYGALPPILSIPVVAILTFALSLISSAVLRRIPVIGKFIC
jgi:surface polysaccharide O-acyltransferase-like enzyme